MTRTAGGTRPQTEPAARRRRHRTGWVLGGAGAALFLAMLAGVWVGE